MKSVLFFDNASTTRCCDAALDRLRAYSTELYANPSSQHSAGETANTAIRQARERFANIFNVEPDQIIFTGSGTEANNLALQGITFKRLLNKSQQTGVISLAIEHPSVRNTALSLIDFKVPVTLLNTDTNGQITEQNLLDKIDNLTSLISIQAVNNVTGAILPIEKLAAECKKNREDIVFHSDAIQAFGRITLPRHPSSVDLISISAHKINGPKGIGALIVLNRSLLKELRPLIYGGGQEYGLRSGTPNVGLIAAFHAALEHTLEHRDIFEKHTNKLREQFLSKLGESKRVTINSPRGPLGISNIINFSIPGHASGPFSRLLDEYGCIVATGSACDSRRNTADPVLTAMGFTHDIASSSLRISFSLENKIEDIDLLATAIHHAINRMDLLSGNRPGKKRLPK
jgi:cysteine desulfurase